MRPWCDLDTERRRWLRGQPRARVGSVSVHRYYDPATGQFLTVDPLADITGSAYAYAGDDPIDNSDPNGAIQAPAGNTSDPTDIGFGATTRDQYYYYTNLGITNLGQNDAGAQPGSPIGQGTVGYTAQGRPSLWTQVAIFALTTVVAPEEDPEEAAAFIAEDTGAEEGAAAVRGGESAAAAYGRAIHATYDYGPGFEREFVLENGQRADAVNLATREVVELKPNNPAAIARGLRQVRGYARKLDQEFPGDPFSYRVITYNRP